MTAGVPHAEYGIEFASGSSCSSLLVEARDEKALRWGVLWPQAWQKWSSGSARIEGASFLSKRMLLRNLLSMAMVLVVVVVVFGGVVDVGCIPRRISGYPRQLQSLVSVRYSSASAQVKLKKKNKIK